MAKQYSFDTEALYGYIVQMLHDYKNYNGKRARSRSGSPSTIASVTSKSAVDDDIKVPVDDLVDDLVDDPVDDLVEDLKDDFVSFPNDGSTISYTNRCTSDHFALNFYLRNFVLIVKYRNMSVLMQYLMTLFNYKDVFKKILDDATGLTNLIKFIKGTFGSNKDVVCIVHDDVHPIVSYLLAATISCDIHAFNTELDKTQLNQYDLPNLKYYTSIDDLSFCKKKNVVVVSTHSIVDIDLLLDKLDDIDVLDKSGIYWSSCSEIKHTSIQTHRSTKKMKHGFECSNQSADSCESVHTMLHYFIDLITSIAHSKDYHKLEPLGLSIFGRKKVVKEIIENTTAVYNITTYIKQNFDIDPKEIVAICHGDGHQPRSGYLLSLATPWMVYSIDPEMEQNWLTQTYLPNLTCHRSVMEDFDLSVCQDKFVVIVGVHSHADLNELWNRLNDVAHTRVALSIPCCGHVEHEVQLPTKVCMCELEILSKDIGNVHKNCHVLMWTDRR